MFDYMIPAMEEIFNEVKNELISDYHINQMETNPYSMFTNPISEIDEPFLWQDLFYNISLAGLQNSTPFQENISNNTLKDRKSVV